MSWFSTSAFSFELPGDRWEERTVNLFRPRHDDRSVFMLGRAKIPEGGPVPFEELLDSLPMGPYDERKIVRHEPCRVGMLEGEDVSLFARTGASGEYYRFVSVPYYDLEVTFQFAGPIADRQKVDENADRTLDSVRFRKR
jgi:hypothetical protein